MNTTETPSPIFIIGSYRSGTSVLTWCLGQHPRILALEETNWIGYLSVYLDTLYLLGTTNTDHSNLSSIGTTSEEFHSYFGWSVDNFIRSNIGKYIEASKKRGRENPHLVNDRINICRSDEDPKTRWVDGTPENSHFVYGLHKLYPDARFIHILRNPGDVARSLQNFENVGQQNYSEENAYCTWTRLVTASVEAEVALGPEKVLRVLYDDLVREPKQVLKKCLDFVGEAFSDSCLLPLQKRINSSFSKTPENVVVPRREDSTYVKEAFDLYEGLLRDDVQKQDDVVYHHMEEKYLLFAKQFRLEEVDKLTEWGCTLNKEIAQRDARIIQLQKEVEELGNWGQGLDRVVMERESQIADLKKRLQAR